MANKPKHSVAPTPVPGAGFTLYLAGSQNTEQMYAIFNDWDWERNPVSILLTYAYPKVIEKFFELVRPPGPRRLMLDSGAFTAWSVGREIHLREYAAYIRSSGHAWDEIVGLDKVGDPELTIRNWQTLQQAVGRTVLPVHHIGEDFAYLSRMVEMVGPGGRVGLSCRFGEPLAKSEWYYKKCFATAWPFSYHSFGWAGRKVLHDFPFGSADASSFLASSVRYGNWKAFGQMSARGPDSYVGGKAEVLHAIALERRVRGHWCGRV